MINDPILRKQNFMKFIKLNIATQNGHINIVELLINNSADVNQKNNENCTALFKG